MMHCCKLLGNLDCHRTETLATLSHTTTAAAPHCRCAQVAALRHYGDSTFSYHSKHKSSVEAENRSMASGIRSPPHGQSITEGSTCTETARACENQGCHECLDLDLDLNLEEHLSSEAAQCRLLQVVTGYVPHPATLNSMGQGLPRSPESRDVDEVVGV